MKLKDIKFSSALLLVLLIITILVLFLTTLISYNRLEVVTETESTLLPLTLFLSALLSLVIFVLSFFKIYKDINNLKKANNQLLINKGLFEHNETISNICNWCWDIDSNQLTFSNNIYSLLGCEEKDLEHSVLGFIQFVHPEDKAIVVDSAKRAINKLETGTIYYRVIRKDKVVCYFKSVSKLIKDDFERDIMIGVIMDISESHHDSSLLEEKIFDLERTNNELLAFNHVASHDLQEPLRKIQTFISRIEETEVTHLTEKGMNYFSRIKFAAMRMQKLIDDLLTFSRTNKAEESYEMTDLTILLENSIHDLNEFIEEKNVTINTSILPMLNVIPFQIQQLFTNIIGNAIKYCKEDVSSIITIDSEIICGKDFIKSKFSSENKLVKISFTDNGIGFEQEYGEEIFTLFSRLHNKNAYSGNGIGLAICKKIVENHKGYIIAESSPGIGSKFTVFLPFVH